MKKTTSQRLILLALAIFIFPSVALAAWWNPFSWGVWGMLFNNKTNHISSTVSPSSGQSANPLNLSQTYAEPGGTFTVHYPQNWKLTVTQAIHSGSITVPTQIALSFFSGRSSSIVSIVPGAVIPDYPVENQWNALLKGSSLLTSNGATKVVTTISGFDAIGVSKTIAGVTTIVLSVKTPTRITEVNETYTPDQKATADAIINSLVLH